MITAQQALRERGVPTFIFSNTNELAVGHIRRTFPFFASFDGYILSFEHGAMKPEEPLYDVVERLAGRERHRLLYFDDRPENVETASRRGWQAVVHRDSATSIAVLRTAGLLD
jgi:HAD superfamily hydrolase (TIGR01509 family)